MNTTQKRRIGAFFLVSALSAVALVSYTRTTWITENSKQVTVRMPTCTDTTWRVCQHIALVHLAQAIDKYPNARQYQVRWCGQWFPLDETAYYVVTYDQGAQWLQEDEIDMATMDTCHRVTSKSIHAVARDTGGFEALAKYGADYSPI